MHGKMHTCHLNRRVYRSTESVEGAATAPHPTTEPTIGELKRQFRDESGRTYESVAGDYLMMLQQDAQSSSGAARILKLYNKIKEEVSKTQRS